MDSITEIISNQPSRDITDEGELIRYHKKLLQSTMALQDLHGGTVRVSPGSSSFPRSSIILEIESCNV